MKMPRPTTDNAVAEYGTNNEFILVYVLIHLYIFCIIMIMIMIMMMRTGST